VESTVAATIRPVTIAEIHARDDLWRANHQEAEGHLGLAIQPDWLRLLALESREALLSLGAFVGRELVGYSVGYVSPHIHYSHVLVYQSDVLFVASEHRRGGTGKSLLNATVDEARALGCRRFYFHAKPGSAFEGLLRRCRFSECEIVFAREDTHG
jgi:GNAT superfamily N-acetyltransferase